MKKLMLLIALLPLSIIAAEPKASVGLAWNANTEADLAGYRLYRGTNSGSYVFTRDIGLQIQAVETNLVPGITYFWVVTAYNRTGLESEPSNEVSYTIPSITVPVPPSSNHVAKVVIEQVRVDTTTNTVTIFP